MEDERNPAPVTQMVVDVDRLAASIVTAACELDGPADHDSDDTVSITVKDLEAVVHRHVMAAIERAASSVVSRPLFLPTEDGEFNWNDQLDPSPQTKLRGTEE